MTQMRPRIKDYDKLLTTIIEEAVKADLEVKFLKHLVYGEEGFAFPLLRSNSKKAKYTAFLVAGQHGDEYWSIDCLIHALSDLDKDLWNLFVVPAANPWGWAHTSRLTGDKKGSNWKVGERDTAELGLIFKSMPTKISLFIDIHGDKDETKAYIYERKLPGLDSLARLILNDTGSYFEVRNTKTVYRELCRQGVVNSGREGTLEEYAYEKRGATYSLTLEIPGRVSGTGVNQIAGGARMIVAALNNFERALGKGVKIEPERKILMDNGGSVKLVEPQEKRNESPIVDNKTAS